MTLGVGLRDLVALSREAHAGVPASGPLVVSGPGAAEVGEALGAGGRGGLLVVGGDPSRAGALVRVLDGGVTPDDRAALQAAARAGVPLVVLVRSEVGERIPYALATQVLAWPEATPVPSQEIARVLAGGLREEAIALAAGLPALRGAIVDRRARDTALVAAALTLLRHGKTPLTPVLVPLQARMLRRLEAARGTELPAGPQGLATAVGPEVAGAVATGVVCRAVARSLPLRSRLLDAAVAYGGTVGLALVADRVLRRR